MKEDTELNTWNDLLTLCKDPLCGCLNTWDDLLVACIDNECCCCCDSKTQTGLNTWDRLLIAGKSQKPEKKHDARYNDLRRELRENACPFFSDSDIEYYLKKNRNDFRATVYEMLLVKAEDSTIVVSGLTTADTSAYFRRLASRFRKYNSGVLKSD